MTRYEAVGAGGSREPREPGVEFSDSAIPEWTSTATLDWKLGNWSASWSIRHIDELTEECRAAAVFPVCSGRFISGVDENGEDIWVGTNKLDATTYHDAQVGYKFNWLKGLQLTAGVNNLFDEDPPICLSCSLNGYDASTYDIPRGRFWYLRANLKF